jgi:phosphoribosylanthranilate isomerase
VPVLTKICGLSTPDTLDAAIAGGASHVGFVHFPPSPRHLDLEQAAALRRHTPSHVKTVLLLVNAEPALVARTVDIVRPDIIQFHGNETPEWLKHIRGTGTVGVWKAFGTRDRAALERSANFTGAVDLLLFDAPAQALPGGNGTRIDWTLFTGHRHSVPWGLAGGLDPSNVAEAIRITGAPLVDVSSGVESAPGVKHVDKIAAFLKAANP